MQFFLMLPRHGFWLRFLIATYCFIALFTSTGGISFASNRESVADHPIFSIKPYNPSSSIKQSYFVIGTQPGALLQEEMQVANTGTATGTVKFSPADTTTGQTSGVTYSVYNPAQRDVGSWITLDTQQLTLSPGQSKVVRFKVIVPQNARPGQHVGGIIAESTPQKSDPVSADKSHIQINEQLQTIIAVQLNLPGPQTEQLTATSVQAGGANNFQILTVGLHNTGNVMLKPHGNLQVTDSQGKTVQNLTMNLDTFLPQTAINYPVAVQSKALGAGIYKAALTLHYGHNHILNYTTTFTITQQQVKQAFPNGPLQPPSLTNSSLPLWAMILLAVLGVLVVGGLSGMFFWRLAIRSITGSSNMGAGGKKSKRNKKG